MELDTQQYELLKEQITKKVMKHINNQYTIIRKDIKIYTNAVEELSRSIKKTDQINSNLFVSHENTLKRLSEIENITRAHAQGVQNVYNEVYDTYKELNKSISIVLAAVLNVT